MGYIDRCCNIYVRMAWSGIGAVMTVSACFIWGIQYHNYSAMGFTIAASVYAFALFGLHVWYWRTGLQEWTPPAYYAVYVLAGLAQLAGVAGICTFIALGVRDHTDFNNYYGNNWWLSIVWAWMLWKWSFQCFWYARKYWKLNEQGFFVEGMPEKGTDQMIVINSDVPPSNYNSSSKPRY